MLSFVVSIVVGLIVGVLSGMLGIGGGVIMVPVFRLGFAMQAIQATATSLFTIISTSIAGCVTHIRNKTCLPSVGIAAGLGGALLSPVGVHLAAASPSWAIMAVAAAIIAYSAIVMFRKAKALPGKSQSAGAMSEETPSASLSPKLALSAAAIGMGAGIASGYVGVGGGFIMVPLFVSVLGLGMKKASGTSLIAVSILAIPGVASQLLMGNVFVSAGIAMAIGSVPGAVLGAKLAKRIPERQLRYLFSGLLVVVAVLLIAKEIGV